MITTHPAFIADQFITCIAPRTFSRRVSRRCRRKHGDRKEKLNHDGKTKNEQIDLVFHSAESLNAAVVASRRKILFSKKILPKGIPVKMLKFLTVLEAALCIGCSPGLHERQERSLPQSLLFQQAARRAADLANDKCQQLYGRRPFYPDQYAVASEDGLYVWGRMDGGGPSGYSAVVKFRPDGSNPSVEVLFNSDLLIPPRPSR